MGNQDSTCWTLVRGAASGNPADRESFAVRYGPVISAYLAARWRLPWDHEVVVDAAQEVFLQLFKVDGALKRVEHGRDGGFRAFLYGVLRNVASASEGRRARRRELQTASEVVEIAESEASLSRVFDKAWAGVVTREARELMKVRAKRGSSEALGFRALEMRYQDGTPSREIAEALEIEPQAAYEALTRARREFRSALLEVMAGYHPNDSKGALERRCVELLAAL